MIEKLINIIKKVKKIHVFFLLLIIITFFVLMPKTQATSGDKVFGYAWSDNIGWISFNNCTNPSTCSGAVDYGVTYDDQTKLLTGYAWSPVVGLIKFGGFTVANLPTGGGTSKINATISLDTSTTPVLASLKGWVRACAGTVSGDCSTMTSRTDGWDGWISLSGTGYGVKFDALTGDSVSPSSNHAAWGSDVIGWLDFSGVSIDPPPVFTIPSSMGTLSTNRTCVTTTNATALLSWSTSGMSSCELFKDGVSSNVSTNEANHSVLVSSPNSTFFLRCLDNNTPPNYSDSNSLIIENKAICPQIIIDKKPSYIEI